jgi:serine/threonine protein kinase/WD40 repeat protein
MAELSGDRDVLLNELADEFAARYRSGERPALTDYVQRHPELADDIRELFPALVEMEVVKAAAEAPGTEPEIALPPLEHFGDFQILREIGRGGMGVVYEAEQISLGRRVALKLLTQRMLRDGVQKRRFDREAKAAARLHHTNIVPVFGSGEHEGTPYYVMQFIQGLGLDVVSEEIGRLDGRPTPQTGRNDVSEVTQSLMTGGFRSVGEPHLDPPFSKGGRGGSGSHARAVADTSEIAVSMTQPSSSAGGSDRFARKLTYWQGVARIGVQVAGALDYAHRQGIIHRDVKPSNLLLDLSGTAWVTDFGLAKGEDQDNLTRTGDMLGTLRYMPPEAFDGKADVRSDVYGLGITLYEMLALQPAFGQIDRNKLVKAVTTSAPARLRLLRPSVPRDLETIVHKAIEREPGRRYRTAAELAADLQRFLDDEPIKARRATEFEKLWMWVRRRPAIAGLISALLLCLLAGTITSMVFAVRAEKFARAAAAREADATVARDAAWRNADEAEQQKARAEAAHLDALDKTYLAIRNEVRAMRLARQSGWRTAALEKLQGLVRLGSRNLDRVDLRTEALACLAEMDVRLRLKFGTPYLGAWHVRYSPDGQTIAVNDEKNSRVYLQNLTTNQELPSIPKSVGQAPFAFHPSGTMAVPCAAGRVAFHPLRPGQPSFPEIEGEGHALNLAFSRTGDRIAIVWGDVNLQNNGMAVQLRRVTVHDPATGAMHWSRNLPDIRGHYKVALALSPDGRSLATVGADWEVRLYSVGTNDEPVVLGKLDDRICALDFHPDGTSLVGAGYKIAAAWDLKSHSEIHRMHVPEDGFWDIAYSPDGQLIAGASGGFITRLWDAQTGRELAAVPAECGANCLSLAFSPRGDRFAVAGGTVAIFEIEGRQECRYQNNHVNGLAFDPTQPALFSCGGDNLVRVWNLRESAATELRSTGRTVCPQFIRLAPDGRHLALGFVPYSSSGTDVEYSISVWSLDHPIHERRLQGPKKQILELAFDATGKQLAAVSENDGLYLWDFESGALRYRAELANIKAARFLDDGQLLVAAGKRLLVLAGDDGTISRDLNLSAVATGLVVAPNQKEAFVGTSDGSIHRIRLTDLTNDQSRRVFDSAMLMAISPDGKLLALGTSNLSTSSQAGVQYLLVDPRTLDLFARLPGHDMRLRCMEFDHDGRRLSVGGGIVALWDLALVRSELARLDLGIGDGNGLAP